MQNFKIGGGHRFARLCPAIVSSSEISVSQTKIDLQAVFLPHAACTVLRARARAGQTSGERTSSLNFLTPVTKRSRHADRRVGLTPLVVYYRLLPQRNSTSSIWPGASLSGSPPRGHNRTAWVEFSESGSAQHVYHRQPSSPVDNPNPGMFRMCRFGLPTWPRPP
jgi:hypothetical protein